MPLMADAAFLESDDRKYRNFSESERVSFSCTALSNCSQKDCHSVEAPLNRCKLSFGSLTWVCAALGGPSVGARVAANSACFFIFLLFSFLAALRDACNDLVVVLECSDVILL